MIDIESNSLKIDFIAELNNIRRVFDPNSGWEVVVARGDFEPPQGAIPAIPVPFETVRAKGYRFLRNGRLFYTFAAAIPQLPHPRLVIAFVHSELLERWERTLRKKSKEMAPEIRTADDFIQLIRIGVSALETLTTSSWSRKLEQLII
jgi:hypothetical protein